MQPAEMAKSTSVSHLGSRDISLQSAAVQGHLHSAGFQQTPATAALKGGGLHKHRPKKDDVGLFPAPELLFLNGQPVGFLWFHSLMLKFDYCWCRTSQLNVLISETFDFGDGTQ